MTGLILEQGPPTHPGVAGPLTNPCESERDRDEGTSRQRADGHGWIRMAAMPARTAWASSEPRAPLALNAPTT